MARTISIGAQGFEQLRQRNNFYVDKTGFVRDWWLADDAVTLLCRPRRFGKTLSLDTVRCFLSTEFAGRGEELFGGLEVWDDPAMRAWLRNPSPQPCHLAGLRHIQRCRRVVCRGRAAR